MKDGFLIVDKLMNTVIVPIEQMPKLIDTTEVHRNRTLKELDKDIRKYLKNKYYEEENNDKKIL